MIVATCGECVYFSVEEGKEQGVCRFNPPSSQLIQTPHPVTSREMVTQQLSLRPVVNRSELCCGRFENSADYDSYEEPEEIEEGSADA